MTPPRSSDTKQNQKILNIVLLLVMTMGIVFFVLETPAQASQTENHGQVAIAAQATPLPAGTVTQIPEEIIREGQPSGIIIGAIIIVMIILGGTAPLLLKR